MKRSNHLPGGAVLAAALLSWTVIASAGPDPGPLSISSVSAGSVSLQWPAIPGRQYRVEESADLLTWQWGSPFTATTLDLSRVMNTGSYGRFYRIAETRSTPEWQTAFFCLPGPGGTEPDYTLENKVTELLNMA